MLGLNKPNEGGIITANTFNLTRITSAIAAALGVGTAASGFGARVTDSGPEEVDWAGFTQGQRLVILVALIAAVAIVHSTDLLARSVATSRAVSAGVIPLRNPLPATLTNNTPNQPDYQGQAVALRPDGQVLFRRNDNQQFEWAPNDQVTFT